MILAITNIFLLGVEADEEGGMRGLVQQHDLCPCLRFAPDQGTEPSLKPAGSVVDPAVGSLSAALWIPG